MAEKIDENDLPPPVKHKALLNVDLGEAVSFESHRISTHLVETCTVWQLQMWTGR